MSAVEDKFYRAKVIQRRDFALRPVDDPRAGQR